MMRSVVIIVIGLMAACVCVMGSDKQRTVSQSQDRAADRGKGASKMRPQEVARQFETDVSAGVSVVRDRGFRDEDMIAIAKHVRAGKINKNREVVADLFVLWEQWKTDTFQRRRNYPVQREVLAKLLKDETKEAVMRKIIFSMIACSGRIEAYPSDVINKAGKRELRAIGSELVEKMAHDLDSPGVPSNDSPED